MKLYLFMKELPIKFKHQKIKVNLPKNINIMTL